MKTLVLCAISLCFNHVSPFTIYSDVEETSGRGKSALRHDVTEEFMMNDTNLDFVNTNIDDSEIRNENMSSGSSKLSPSASSVQNVSISEFSTAFTIPETKLDNNKDSSILTTISGPSAEENQEEITSTNISKMPGMTTENVSPSPPSVSPENATCHLECLSTLDKATFSMVPNTTLLKAGMSLTLECSLPAHENSSARLIWLFQGTNPPEMQCSLTPQETLTSCDSFTSIDHIVDTNVTSGYTKEVVILGSLMEKNSGYYYCMIQLSCCSNSHVMEQTSGTNKPVQVYFEDYALELKVLVSTTLILLVLLGIGGVIQNCQRKTIYKSILVSETTMSGDVLHAPFLEDEDSFEESENDEE